jgi:hypothetical protein
MTYFSPLIRVCELLVTLRALLIDNIESTSLITVRYVLENHSSVIT